MVKIEYAGNTVTFASVKVALEAFTSPVHREDVIVCKNIGVEYTVVGVEDNQWWLSREYPNKTIYYSLEPFEYTYPGVVNGVKVSDIVGYLKSMQLKADELANREKAARQLSEVEVNRFKRFSTSDYMYPGTLVKYGCVPGIWKVQHLEANLDLTNHQFLHQIVRIERVYNDDWTESDHFIWNSIDVRGLDKV